MKLNLICKLFYWTLFIFFILKNLSLVAILICVCVIVLFDGGGAVESSGFKVAYFLLSPPFPFLFSLERDGI